ncbi:Flotillin-like protein 2 [Dissostichus eleginoides]|uniref:Flotillin-like protein 2 n=1 Tax=Dissostichus eleginoides TaxID=100907 RepID=A0AAD9F6F8_DISEL|nr:Flotillin-like protein 2 [Dissostichus eleginoides]
MILLLASMGEDFVLPLLDMRCAAAEAVLPGCRRRGCPPRMQKERLSSQDAAGRHSRGVLQERLSSQDAAGRHSRGVLQERLSSQDAEGEAVLPGCRRRGCPPRMQEGVRAEVRVYDCHRTEVYPD